MSKLITTLEYLLEEIKEAEIKEAQFKEREAKAISECGTSFLNWEQREKYNINYNKSMKNNVIIKENAKKMRKLLLKFS